MPYKSLSDFIEVLKKNKEIISIDYPISCEYEITEIIDRVVKSGGPALLFTNNGTEFPVLINAFGSERRMCIALGVEKLDDIAESIQKVFGDFLSPKKSIIDKFKFLPALSKLSNILPKSQKSRGQCQQVIINEPDLYKLPILKCWPHDGGSFITLPVVHTIDYNTGMRNVGMYRMQVMSNNTTGMHWHLHKGSAKHYDVYKKSTVNGMKDKRPSWEFIANRYIDIFEKVIIIYGIISMKEALLLSFKKAQTITVKDL